MTPGLFYIRDQRSKWISPLAKVAKRRGWTPRMVDQVEDIEGGYGFIRPHAHPEELKIDLEIGRQMGERLTLIQDQAQIEVYDDKRAQIERWSRWMPETWVFRSLDDAMAFLKTAPFPLISKADVGASSRNVRFLVDRDAAETHLRQIFGDGVRIDHCCSPRPHYSLQQGYAILQQFIPHEITYRVNAIGHQRAVFFRRCYADRPLAQTGNTTPALAMTHEVGDVLAYAERIFEAIGTRWCALDILRDGYSWRLLETSLCWPWPSPGNCNDAVFFDCETGAKHPRRWIQMFDVMFDEIDAGAWAPLAVAA